MHQRIGMIELNRRLKLFLENDIGGCGGFGFGSVVHPFLLQCCIVNGYHNLPWFTNVKRIPNTVTHFLLLVLPEQNFV